MMNEKFAKLVMKKKKEGRGLSDVEKAAKMSVVGGMKKMASDEMNGRLSGLKKVTVASDNEEGLEKGLDKAKELVGEKDSLLESLEEETGEDLDHDDETDEPTGHLAKVMGGDDYSDKPDEECTPEELDEKIQHLQMLKAKALKA